MQPTIRCSLLLQMTALCLFPATASLAQTTPTASDPVATTAASASFAATDFDRLADTALAAMRQRADAMTVQGVAVVAYFEGEKIQSWSSKMVVVGRVKSEPEGTQKGSNLLGVAYAKASEMADTLKNSGSQVRPPMTGEFGWEGGVIMHLKNGYLIAAFSGGKSADDVAISRAGVERLLSQVTPSHDGKPAQ